MHRVFNLDSSSTTTTDWSVQTKGESTRFVVPLPGGNSAVGNDASSAHELFSFRFNGRLQPIADGNAVNFPLTAISTPEVSEVWVAHTKPTISTVGSAHLTECEDFQFGYIWKELSSADQISIATQEAYEELLTIAKERGFTHPVRAWNYFPGINQGKNDDEQYRQFSVGRANAFAAQNRTSETFPAATAIGTHSGNFLQIVMLSSREAPEIIENRRQVSAYLYPRKFGPVGPSFARATLVNRHGGKQLLVSGTASISGSESQHPEDFSEQLEETLVNLRTLTADCGWTHSATADNENAPIFRVYLRTNKGCSIVRRRLEEEFGKNARVYFLRGDICRSELILEIEGAFWI